MPLQRRGGAQTDAPASSLEIAPDSPGKPEGDADVPDPGSCRSRLKSRLLSCAGLALLLQNVFVFYWQRSHPPACPAPSRYSPLPSVPAPVTTSRSAPKNLRTRHKKRKQKKKEKKKQQAQLVSSTQTTPPTWSPASTNASRQHGPLPPRLTPLTSLYSIPRERLRIFGESPPGTVQISVGFGSVKRKKDYVLSTVGSMLGMDGKTQIAKDERSKVVMVAHLADFDLGWVHEVSGKLHSAYAQVVAEGHFHVIHAPEELYPPLEVCPPLCTYGDEARRVKWRSKQNIDYAFLMYYAIPLAPFYIQIEDDLGVANNWISKMHNYVTTGTYGPSFRGKSNEPWRVIDFSELGFIGKMFQANELIRMAQFLLVFYDQMPCDLLLDNFLNTMNQKKRIDYWRKSPSLFQHLGVFRTLGGFQMLQERRFGKLVFDNPACSIVSTMALVDTYEAKFAYFPGGEPRARNDKCDFSKSKAAHDKQKTHRCWYWASKAPKGSHLTLQFSTKGGILIKAMFFHFGHAKHPKDVLHNGSIQVAGPHAQNAGCGEFLSVLPVHSDDQIYWEEKVSDPGTLPIPKVQCLRILVTETQTNWVALQSMMVRSM